MLQISQAALENNLNLIQKLTGPGVRTLIPVKANAYGCGLAELFPFFARHQIDFLGVANPWEARQLRLLGWNQEILNLGGFFPENIELFTDYRITPSITDLWQLPGLNELAGRRGVHLPIHIKWDLGMGRIGLKKEHYAEAVELLKNSSHLRLTGLFTHFPEADSGNQAPTDLQLQTFLELAGRFLEDLKIRREDVLLHSANSYAMINNRATHLDMVRPGLFFYGYFQSLADLQSLHQQFPFQPSLSLLAHPISLRQMKKGEKISYGSTYTVSEEQLSVGTIPLGYADGIPRALSNRISFNGHPLLGRVTMDQIILGQLADSQPVVLLGKGAPPLEMWAELDQTITYEVLTNLGLRLRRQLV